LAELRKVGGWMAHPPAHGSTNPEGVQEAKGRRALGGRGRAAGPSRPAAVTRTTQAAAAEGAGPDL